MVTINIGRKELFFFVGISVLIFLAGFGVAYGGGEPISVGHSAGEMMIVNASGAEKTLQAAIDNGDFAGSGSLPSGCVAGDVLSYQGGVWMCDSDLWGFHGIGDINGDGRVNLDDFWIICGGGVLNP